jgi:hypothetical protein
MAADPRRKIVASSGPHYFTAQEKATSLRSSKLVGAGRQGTHLTGISSRAAGLISTAFGPSGIRPVRLGFAVSIVLAAGFVAPPCFAQTISFDLKDITSQQGKDFQREFSQSNKTLLQFLKKTEFATPFTGDIDVHVFDYAPPVSMALIPSWQGHRGDIKFAAVRVKGKVAAVLHELTHVHAPNQARYLAEGFAVYLEEAIGSIGVYPTVGQSSECAMLRDPSAISSVHLDVFDKVSLGNGAELGAQVGLEKPIPNNPDREAYSYLVSGSFVKFLIRRSGLKKFKTLYDTTPMTPGVVTPIDLNRYEPIFGKSLAGLQTEWLPWLKTKQLSCKGV